jgi:hypothetical protein
MGSSTLAAPSQQTSEQPTQRVIGVPFSVGFDPRRTSFKLGHKPNPPTVATTPLMRLRRQIVRELRDEYGPELTASQKSYIDIVADARARRQLYDISVHPLAIANLNDSERHALQALEGD